MILFAVYAFAVLYAAMRWRRRWQSFAAVGVAVVSLTMVAYLLGSREVVFGLRGKYVAFFMWAEVVVLAGLGFYVACLPRGRGGRDCRSCGYDLTGLEVAEPVCPECGHKAVGLPAVGVERPELTPIPQGPPMKRQEL